MNRLHTAIELLTRKIGYAVKSVSLVFARLIGIKQLDDGRFDTTKLITAIWVFLFGVPIGLVIAGEAFPILGWGTIVFAFLIVANLNSSTVLATDLIDKRKAYTSPQEENIP